MGDWSVGVNSNSSLDLRELYDITSNIESGHGRGDLIMKSKETKRQHLVLEFKQGKDVEK